jgi:glycosyltransferase involved in cell wall biosynthesis
VNQALNAGITISVIIPARNEPEQLSRTIKSIVKSASRADALEIVIVDDASSENIRRISSLNQVPLRFLRNNRRLGVPQSRNRGAELAQGEVLVMTDAHCRFSAGWDNIVRKKLRPNRILASTIIDPPSGFKGYGCKLIVPYMGTHWNRVLIPSGKPVHVASCAGTVIARDLFTKLGGYDDGMILYGAAEPEFSVRAWLSGADIVSEPALEVAHRFKRPREKKRFLSRLRPFMIHNNLRFGLLYLGESASLQMMRHFAMLFPKQIDQAVKLLHGSDVWVRRKYLRRTLARDFDWFIKRFALKDQVGNEILRA